MADPREGLLQHMVAGSTLDDIVSSEEDDYYEGFFDVIESKGGVASPAVVVAPSTVSHANTQQEPTSMHKLQPAQHKHADAQVLSRIRIDAFHEAGGGGGASGATKANQRVINELRDMTRSNRLTSNQRSKEVDRSERATVENVLDPRTRLILYKMVNSGILREINGCVSTGKEANVYYAVAGDGSAAALKVYKTSILVFKDRDQYVSGEFRFQRYCKSNPRKMVRTWAEKEARNLNRLQAGGVLAPAVKLLRQHVLVLEFLGEDGWPAPRLKDVRFPSIAAVDRCYLDLCCTMRKMYGRCKLIHGDLSEYNLLLYRGRVIVIDVSQSVEQDHPSAMDFLRRDIVNVNSFFRSQGLSDTFSPQELFHFITAPPSSKGWQRCHGPDNVDEMYQHLREIRQQRDTESAVTGEQAAVDEQVFLRIAVPRTLNDISENRAPNAEIAHFVADMVAPSPSADAQEEQEDDAQDEEGAGSSEEAAEPRRKAPAVPQRTLAEMTKDERKAHRKEVKEAKRDRREEKKRDAEKHKGHRKKK